MPEDQKSLARVIARASPANPNLIPGAEPIPGERTKSPGVTLPNRSA